MNQPRNTAQPETFTPGPDDMHATHYGLHISPLGEDCEDGYIATGPAARDPRRVLAAVAAHMRDIGALDQLRDQLDGDFGMTVTVTPTTFTRNPDSDPCPWTANPHSPGAPQAAWLVDPGHAAQPEYAPLTRP